MANIDEKLDSSARESENRRAFLKNARGFALAAPAVALLLTASTEMAQAYNNGNTKPVGKAF